MFAYVAARVPGGLRIGGADNHGARGFVLGNEETGVTTSSRHNDELAVEVQNSFDSTRCDTLRNADGLGRRRDHRQEEGVVIKGLLGSLADASHDFDSFDRILAFCCLS